VRLPCLSDEEGDPEGAIGRVVGEELVRHSSRFVASISISVHLNAVLRAVYHRPVAILDVIPRQLPKLDQIAAAPSAVSQRGRSQLELHSLFSYIAVDICRRRLVMRYVVYLFGEYLESAPRGAERGEEV